MSLSLGIAIKVSQDGEVQESEEICRVRRAYLSSSKDALD